MTKPPGVWVWALLFCWLAMLAASEAGAARHRSRRPSQKEQKAKEQKAKKTSPEASKDAEAEPKSPSVEKPETFLSEAREQEKGGDIAGALKTLSKFVNVFPRHPEREATLFRMARLARENQQPERATSLYALAASLYPNSQMAVEARWQVVKMEFYRDLRESESLVVFRNFLKRVAPLAASVPAAEFREPILRGWEVVERAVRKKNPCPVSLLDEVLALWELHPEGIRPPEAALLLGELLQAGGFCGEARAFLVQAREKGSPEVRTQALVGLLEGAWASRDLPDFAGTWMLWRRHRGEMTPAIKSRLAKLPLPKGFFSPAPAAAPEGKAEEDAVAALLDWWNGKAVDGSRQGGLLLCLEHFLSRPLPPAVKERLQLELAHLQWSQGKIPQAAKIYRKLLAANRGDESSAFYRDRLALAQLQGRRQEAALEIYRGLSQGEDNFWQLLSRTRMADVELRRLQVEPGQ